MTAIWTWLRGSAAWLVFAAVAIAGVVALVFGMRRASEALGRSLERLEQERRAAHARRDMEDVPQPGRDDVDERLRDGTY